MRNILLGAILVGLAPACLVLSPLDEARTDAEIVAGKGGSTGTGGSGGSSAGKGSGGSSKGGSSSTGGSGGSMTVMPHTCSDPLMIDDMEAPSHTTNICQSNRTGGWYIYTDGTGTTTPAVSTDGGPPFPYSPLDTPRAGSTYAAHVAGSGQTVFGGGMGIGMHYPDAPYNVGDYSGIQFWAKGTGSVRVDFSTMQTQEVAFGGDCVATALDCGDHYSMPISLSAAWQQYTISFGELTQQGWGVPAINFFTDQLLGINFAWTQGSTFDIWVDDLKFIAADCDSTTYTTTCPTATTYQTCWYNTVTTFNCSAYCPMIGFTGADTCSAGSCDCPTPLRPDCVDGAFFYCACSELAGVPCVDGQLSYEHRACFRDAPGYEYISCFSTYVYDPLDPTVADLYACTDAATYCLP